MVDGPQYVTAASTTECSELAAGGQTKTVEVTVKLSTGANANGAIVTLIHPETGPDCWGATGSNGRVSFPNITRGSQFLITVRDEVSVDAPRLEIGPADPNSVALSLLYDAPSIPGIRQQPTILSGAACTTKSALTWDSFVAARGALCTVPTTGSPTYGVSVQLSTTPVLNITVLNPDGSAAGNALVAAISTPTFSPSNTIAQACAQMPWLTQSDCQDENLFSGPGLVQAMSVTPNSGPGKGMLGLGTAQGSNPMFIEVTSPQNGFTLFGTLELSAIGSTSNAAHTIYLAPGMCRITKVDDAVEPAGFSELDIRWSEHSLGLSAVASDGELGPMQLNVESSSIVVRALIHATATGGTGNFTFQYAGMSGGNKTIRIPFSITGGACTPGSASGNGVAGGVSAVGYCTDKGTVGDRTEFDLYFTITDLPELSRAGYNIDAAKDNLDPSRADGTEGRKLSRGSIDIDLTPVQCDVPTNNDGRWLIL